MDIAGLNLDSQSLDDSSYDELDTGSMGNWP